MFRHGVAIILLSLSLPTGAALIDNGNYTTDTSTGLAWLDLSLTDGMSHEEALVTYSWLGYEIADNQQVVRLLRSFGIKAPDYRGMVFDHMSVSNFQARIFMSLFGWTKFMGSLGSFADPGSKSGDSSYLCISVHGCFPSSFISDLDISAGGREHGVFMVRAVPLRAVPVPGAGWLFGLAVLGLGWVKRLGLD